MDKQVILARGQAATELMQNDEFNRVFKDLMDHYITSIVQSSPEDAKIRDASYYGTRALQDLVGILQQWIAMKDQILAEQE